MKKKRKTTLFHYLVAFCLLIVLWILPTMGCTSSLIFPVIIGGSVYFGLRKQFLLLALLLILNPLAYFFFLGCVSYFDGKPTLQYTGLPQIESHNVDRTTRCFVSQGGCLLSGNEWVYLTPHNCAISLLSVILGPAEGCYDGPYPTKEVAMGILENNGKVLPFEEFLNDKLSFDDNVVQLEPATSQKILNRLGMSPDIHTIKITASLYEKRCVVCRIRAYDEYLINKGEDDEWSPDYLIFYDANNGMPFAYFRIKGLVSRFHPVEYTDQSNIHGFFHAAEKGDTKQIEELLNLGFNINAQSITGRTALMQATSSGKSRSVQFFLLNGANPNIEDNNGQTALYMVSHPLHIECMKLLLEYGADVNVKDFSGSTPLTYMVRFGPPQAVQLLIDAGAQLDEKDIEGFTAFEYAIKEEREKARSVLEAAKKMGHNKLD